MSKLIKGVFALGAVALMLIAFALMGVTIWRLVAEGMSGQLAEDALLGAVGYLIVAIAVFDVAKYILEEEVVSDDERRNAAETRRSLTKFGSTIVIAVLLEGLVLAFEVARDDVSDLVWPILLMLMGTVLLVCIAVFQRLSASTEKLVNERDPEAAPAARRGKS